MKKITFTLGSILLILCVLFSVAPKVFADNDPIHGADLNGTFTATRTNGKIQVTVPGTLTTDGRNDITNLLGGRNVYIRYQPITDISATANPNWKANWIWPDSFTDSECTVDDASKGNGFTCTTGSDLHYGGYIFQIGSRRGSSTWTSFISPQAFNIGDQANNPLELSPKWTSGPDISSLKSTVQSGNSIQVTGTLDAASTKKQLGYSAPFAAIKVFYGTQKTSSDGQEVIADLSNSAVLKFNDNGTFSGVITGLKTGMTVIVIKDVSASTPLILSSYLDVLVVEQANGYILTDPVSTGGSLIDASGYWADPQVTVKNPDPGSYQLELGYAKAPSSGNVYTCTLDSINQLGQAVPVPDGKTEIVVNNPTKFNHLQAGLYCVGMMHTSPALAGLPTGTTSQVMVNPPGGNYFLKIISVGGAAIPANATLNSNANGNGCVTSGTINSSYCLLAPLPGVGDAQGKLDVSTGLGDYIKAIIRLIMGLISVLSVLMIVIGGIEYMSSTSLSEKEGGKERITNAIFGLVLALASYMILYTINPNLTNLNVKVGSVSVEVGENDYVPTASVGTTTPSPTGSGKSDVSKNITEFDSLLAAAAAANGVECTFAKAIMYRESHGVNNPPQMSTYTLKDGTVGHAYGLMQLVPGTYQTYGGSGDIKDAASNINAGVKYIAHLQAKGCNGSSSNSVCKTSDLKYVAAGYNAGEGKNAPSSSCPTMTQWECTVNYRLQQTRDYASTVINNYQKLKANNWGC